MGKRLVFCLSCFFLMYLGCVMGTIVMSSGGTYKVILGWIIPLDLHLPIAIIYNHNFQFQYATVDNSSQVTYVLNGGRRKRAVITRNNVYSMIEKMMETREVDKDCLLRAICEVSSSPLAHNGLFGEIIDHILSPKTTDGKDDYSKAWRTGLEEKLCLKRYSQCPLGQSILDHISYYK